MLSCKEINAGQILQIGSFTSAMLRPANLIEISVISALPLRKGREIVQSCQILLAFRSKVPTEMALLKRPPAYSFGLYPKGPTCYKLCHFECFNVSSSCWHVPLDLSKPVQVAWKCKLAISSMWQPSVFSSLQVFRGRKPQISENCAMQWTSMNPNCWKLLVQVVPERKRRCFSKRDWDGSISLINKSK